LSVGNDLVILREIALCDIAKNLTGHRAERAHERLRKTGAPLHYNGGKGVPLATISEWLGHSSKEGK
jgi:hypothetical protein